MPVGFSQTKADWDARTGQLALTIRDWAVQAINTKAGLDSYTDAQLIALGYVQADVNTMRSAVTDLAKLATIYQGTVTQATIYDFRQFAHLLTGVV